MPAQKGRLFLILVGDGGGPEQFTAVAGLRTNGYTVGKTYVEVTNKDSGGIREALEGAGVSSLSITGGGVFKDKAQFNTLMTNVKNGTFRNFQLASPGFGTFEGPFQVTELGEEADHDGEKTYSLQFENATDWTFTVEP